MGQQTREGRGRGGFSETERGRRGSRRAPPSSRFRRKKNRYFFPGVSQLSRRDRVLLGYVAEGEDNFRLRIVSRARASGKERAACGEKTHLPTTAHPRMSTFLLISHAASLSLVCGACDVRAELSRSCAGQEESRLLTTFFFPTCLLFPSLSSSSFGRGGRCTPFYARRGEVDPLISFLFGDSAATSARLAALSFTLPYLRTCTVLCLPTF